MLVLEAADQLDRLGNKKARGIIAMAKVIVGCNFFFCLIIIVVCNMKCQNPILAYGYFVAEFSFKMVWLYVEQVAAPNMALKVLDMAMQVHGGAGLSSDTVLSHLWVTARTLRIADGPDEVHLGTIGKLELQRSRL